MKIKLFRIFCLLFVLSGVLSLVPAQPTYADAATDKEALALIAECHGMKANGSVLAANCSGYVNCQNLVTITPLCQAIRRLDSSNLKLPDAALKKCLATDRTAKECAAHFAECTSGRLSSGKVSSKDAKECADATASLTKKSEEDKTSCVIDGIGWIICPVMTFLSMIVDGAYAVVSRLLFVQPLLTNTSDPNNSTYVAWSMMRNIANVAFVIAFLVIIFSQVSNVGITNYGIKKMLPRLVIAAVLVNISYWLCAIAVDISNILGTSTSDLFDSIKASLAVPDAGTFGEGTGWQGIVGFVLAGGIAAALIIPNLAALVPALTLVLIAIVVIFLVLTMRQALIILLIVIAPLAFVAYLLPNTESMFKKWKDLLQTLLLMYPIIALIFGASALASKIVMASAEGNAAEKIPVQIMGAMVAIIPLALTPIIMKTAGSTLAKFGGMIGNTGKGPGGWMKNRADAFAAYKKDDNYGNRINRADAILKNGGRGLGGEKSRRRKAMASIRSFGASNERNRSERDKYAKIIAEESGAEYFANRALSDRKFAEKIGGGEARADSIQAAAQSEVDKILKQDTASRKILMRADLEIMNNPQEALEKALRNGNKVDALAAQELLFESGSGGISKFRDAVQKVESEAGAEANYSSVRSDLQRNIVENWGQYAKQKGADHVVWARGGDKKLADTEVPKLDNNELAGQHAGSLAKMASQGNISAEQAKKVLSDPRTSANLNDDKKAVLQNVAGYTAAQVENDDPGRINETHEKANQLNIKHDQDAAYETYEDNIR